MRYMVLRVKTEWVPGTQKTSFAFELLNTRRFRQRMDARSTIQLCICAVGCGIVIPNKFKRKHSSIVKTKYSPYKTQCICIKTVSSRQTWAPAFTIMLPGSRRTSSCYRCERNDSWWCWMFGAGFSFRVKNTHTAHEWTTLPTVPFTFTCGQKNCGAVMRDWAQNQ